MLGLRDRPQQQRHLLDAEHRRYPPRLWHDGEPARQIRAASAAPSHSRIWDSYPKVRFAPDSPLEAARFEPSVPPMRLIARAGAMVDDAAAPPKVRFAPDSLLEGGVSCELVSENA